MSEILEEFDLDDFDFDDDWDDDLFDIEDIETKEEPLYGDVSYCEPVCGFYNSKKPCDICIKRIVDNANKTMIPSSRQITMYLYGIYDGEKHTFEEAAKKFSYPIEKVRSTQKRFYYRLKRLNIEELSLPVRTFNTLTKYGISNLGDLLESSENRFKCYRELGQKSFTEIKEMFQIFEIELKQIPLSDLIDDKRILNILLKNNIESLEQLLGCSRESLLKPTILGGKSLDYIVEKLLQLNLCLNGDAIYNCDNCGQKLVDKENLEEHLCSICRNKVARVSKINEIGVKISGPEYATYTKIGNGFVLYADIKNETAELQKIKLEDFYIVVSERQQSPDSYFTGYIFDEEHLLPFTSKCCAKIWPLKNDLQKIKKDDYAIISLLNNRKRYIFKFVYNGSTWVIDDYYLID